MSDKRYLKRLDGALQDKLRILAHSAETVLDVGCTEAMAKERSE